MKGRQTADNCGPAKRMVHHYRILDTKRVTSRSRWNTNKELLKHGVLCVDKFYMHFMPSAFVHNKYVDTSTCEQPPSQKLCFENIYVFAACLYMCVQR